MLLGEVFLEQAENLDILGLAEVLPILAEFEVQTIRDRVEQQDAHIDGGSAGQGQVQEQILSALGR